jgi:para-aminobenzoate synthetase component 1
MTVQPIVQEIPFQDPLTLFHVFAKEEGAVFLDSAELRPGCGEFSFIAVQPFLQIIADESNNPLVELERALAEYSLMTVPDLPPFQGGAAGFFSYDLCHQFEKIPQTPVDQPVPHLAVGFYDVVIAFDLQQQRAWIFSSGYPEKNAALRLVRAQGRLQAVRERMQSTPTMLAPPPLQKHAITAHFTRARYEAAVQRVKDYIAAGDIFEANLSQRFEAQLPEDYAPFALYQRLRTHSHAPFSAFVKMAEAVLISASPERFLKLHEGCVEARPIKGTRPRGKTAEEDALQAKELISSAKDHAENVMIVDLLRND